MRLINSFSRTVFLMSLSFATYAGDVLTTQQITNKIIKVASQYSKVTTCDASNIRPSDIAALSKWDSAQEPEDAEYLVFWNGDMGCTGGTASYGINFASVKISRNHDFYVDALESSPNVVILGSSLLSYLKVIGASKNEVTIQASCGISSNMVNVPAICDEVDSFNLTLRKELIKSNTWIPFGKVARALGL